MPNISRPPTTTKISDIEEKLPQTPKGNEVLSLPASIVSLGSVLWIRRVTAQLLNNVTLPRDLEIYTLPTAEPS